MAPKLETTIDPSSPFSRLKQMMTGPAKSPNKFQKREGGLDQKGKPMKDYDQAKYQNDMDVNPAQYRTEEEMLRDKMLRSQSVPGMITPDAMEDTQLQLAKLRGTQKTADELDAETAEKIRALKRLSSPKGPKPEAGDLQVMR